MVRLPALGLVIVMGTACPRGGGDDQPPPDAGPPGDAVLLDVEIGHVLPIQAVWRRGDRIVSRDSSLHWVVWDVATRHEIASGDQQWNYLRVQGGTMIAEQGSSGTIEVRSVATGAVTGTIPSHDSFVGRLGIAIDESYVWLAQTTGLEVWSTTGKKLFDVAGDYSRAAVFAAPGELRVCFDPAATQTVDTFEIATGRKTTFSVAGQFLAWFDDGERLVSGVGSTRWVYTKTGQQIAFANLPAPTTTVGQGNHVWTFDGSMLRIYLATDLSAPIQSFALVNETPAIAGPDIALVGDRLEFITLGGTIARRVASDIPCTAFGGDASAWTIGTVQGLVYDTENALRPPAERRSYSLGVIEGLGAASDGTAALSTASGMLMLHVDAGGVRVARTLPLHARHIEFTSDATTMVVADDAGTHVVTVADGSERHAFPGVGFALARSGSLIALLDVTGVDKIDVTYRDLDGGMVPAPGPTTAVRVALSPDGTRVAVTTTPAGSFYPYNLVNASTQIYTRGALVGAVPGVAELWLDDDRLVAATYSYVRSLTLGSITIYEPTGLSLGPVKVAGDGAVALDGDLVYERNTVVNVVTGEIVWRGPTADLGAAIGRGSILYTSGPHLYLGTYR